MSNTTLADQYRDRLAKVKRTSPISIRTLRHTKQVTNSEDTTYPHIFEVVWLYLHARSVFLNPADTMPGTLTIFSNSLYPITANWNETFLGSLVVEGQKDLSKDDYIISSFSLLSASGYSLQVYNNPNINRSWSVSADEATELMADGYIPRDFFQTEWDYRRFCEYTEELKVNKILL